MRGGEPWDAPDPSSGGAIDLTAKLAALSTSVDFISLLTESNRRRLLEGSKQTVLPAGTIALRPKGPSMTYLIESGLARAFWSLPDGRQTTIAIVRPKELVGATLTIGWASWIFIQVITESTVLTLDTDLLRSLAASELDVSAAISMHLAMRIRDAYRPDCRQVAGQHQGTDGVRPAGSCRSVAIGGGTARGRRHSRRPCRFHRLVARGDEPCLERPARRRHPRDRARIDPRPGPGAPCRDCPRLRDLGHNWDTGHGECDDGSLGSLACP
jgi:hypothetical protein